MDSREYDVFLSFRGKDTRDNFTGHLYNYLIQKGISTFKDDEELRRGKELSAELLKAILDSKISVVIFSENYASSKWCLEELGNILECKESRKQMVFPIFYKVVTSNVKNQRGSFGEAFAEHEGDCEVSMETVRKWKSNLTQAANLRGWNFLDGDESKFIENIVKEISKQVLNCTHFDVAEYPVGIESRVQDMHTLLDVGGAGVRMVGIWGTGGIGKTAIAKAVYNSIAHEFEGCSCFLANIRQEAMPHGGVVKLQNFLLNKILGGKELNVTNVDEGITVIRKRLSHKKVLLILDDVSKLEQLKKLIGSLDWFGSGSRVIITTRHKDLLTAYEVNHIYSVKELESHEALELFMSNAFRGNRCYLDDSAELEISTVVRYAQGLPLALNVLGSLLCGRSINQWKDILDSQRRFPNEEIQDVLKISYNALSFLEKEVFLDIACFFKGGKKSYVIQVLNGSGMINDHAIDVLIDKALIRVDKNDNIWMHDLLEDMGKELVRQESPTEPGKRSRLWFHEDVQHVLTENTGTDNIKGIMVNLPKPDEICLTAGSFSNMKNLRIFMNCNGHFSGDVDYLPNALRVLDWSDYPLQSLPSSFTPKKLVALSMRRGCISTLGERFKKLQNLTFMNFDGCKFLTETPNFSELPNLVKLSLTECTSLVKVDDSIGSLNKLATLSLRGCYNLTVIPRKVNFKALEFLDLANCRKLAYFPEFEQNNESLRSLHLSGTAIKGLPSSIDHLTLLEELSLYGSPNLTNLPRSLNRLQHVKWISLWQCPKLATFPDDIYGTLALPSLEVLNLSCRILSNCNFLGTLGCKSTLKILELTGSNIVSLPECIREFVQLEHLCLLNCTKLQGIPRLPRRVRWLQAGGCVSLERFSKLSDLLEGKKSKMIEYINLDRCQRLYHDLAEHLGKKECVLSSLSFQTSLFKIILPVREVPKWFSYRMECSKELGQEYEFSFELPPRLKIENSGLVLCASFEEKQQGIYTIDHFFETIILINEVSIDKKQDHLNGVLSEYDQMSGDTMLLHYVPVRRYMRWAMKENGNICRVQFRLNPSIGNSLCFKSCGVHLVMAHNEHVSESKEVKDDDASHEDLSGDDEELENVYISEDEDLGDDYISEDGNGHNKETSNPQKRKAEDDDSGDEDLLEDDHYVSGDNEDLEDDEELRDDYFSEDVEDSEDDYSEDEEDLGDDYFSEDGNDHEGEPLNPRKWRTEDDEDHDQEQPLNPRKRRVEDDENHDQEQPLNPRKRRAEGDEDHDQEQPLNPRERRAEDDEDHDQEQPLNPLKRRAEDDEDHDQEQPLNPRKRRAEDDEDHDQEQPLNP